LGVVNTLFPFSFGLLFLLRLLHSIGPKRGGRFFATISTGSKNGQYDANRTGPKID